jgi:hypothetical protein
MSYSVGTEKIMGVIRGMSRETYRKLAPVLARAVYAFGCLESPELRDESPEPKAKGQSSGGVNDMAIATVDSRRQHALNTSYQ